MPGALSEILRLYLQGWKPNPIRFLFFDQIGWIYSGNKVVQRKFWPILDSINLPRDGLHGFRHTHLGLQIDSGVPPTVAQEQLRHSDARVTLGIYSHVIGDSQRNAVEEVRSCCAQLRERVVATCAQSRSHRRVQASIFSRIAGVSDGI